MIGIPRGLARSFRGVVRKCRSDRGRPLPPVLVQVDDGRLTLDCSIGEVSATVTVNVETASNERVQVPMSVLDAVEGAAVELHFLGHKGTARWSGRDGEKSLGFDLESCEGLTPPSGKECEFHVVEPRIVTALEECRRVAGHAGGRYAFHRLELNGKAGTISATDGKRALLHHAIAWPFTETLLIPACSVFGVFEITNSRDVRVGYTTTHFVIAAGPWTISLALDTTGRFPGGLGRSQATVGLTGRTRGRGGRRSRVGSARMAGEWRVHRGRDPRYHGRNDHPGTFAGEWPAP